MDLVKHWFLPGTAGWAPRPYEWYFRRTPLGRLIRRREQAVVDAFLDDVATPDDRVLEIGPGSGHYTVRLAARCRSVLAVEPSPAMRRYLQDRLAGEGLSRVVVRPGHLPDRLGVAGPFDGIVAVGVLNYVPRIHEALAAMAAVLAPGGWAIFNVPVRTSEGRIYGLSEAIERRRVPVYSPGEIAAAATAAGLHVRQTRPAGLSRGGLTLFAQAAARADAPDSGAYPSSG